MYMNGIYVRNSVRSTILKLAARNEIDYCDRFDATDILI